MSNTLTMEEAQKIELDIMRFKLYEVKFDLTCEHHQNHLGNIFYEHFVGF